MEFDTEFYNEIESLYPKGLEWGLVGILTKHSKVYTLSYDSKILSGIFEIFCEPIVVKIAQEHNMIIEKSAQTAYPDFTLYQNTQPKNKIAIEVKSTYRKFNKEFGACLWGGFKVNSALMCFYNRFSNRHT